MKTRTMSLFLALMFLAAPTLAADLSTTPILEAEPNNTYATAQTLPLGTLLGGDMDQEDVDVFTLILTEAQNISITGEILTSENNMPAEIGCNVQSDTQLLKTFYFNANNHAPVTSETFVLPAGKYVLKLFPTANFIPCTYSIKVNTHPLPTYTITYEPNGGTLAAGSPTVYTQGKTNPLLPATRIGYTFAGWNPTGTVISDDVFTAIPPTARGNITFAAVWKPNVYKITYDLGGGQLPLTAEDRAYTYGQSKFPKQPTRKGYIFKGWYLGKNLVEQIAPGQLGDVTLTAKWQGEKHAITYDPGAGKLSKKVNSFVVGKGVTKAKFAKIKPKRKGYTFKGWYSSANGAKVTSISKTRTTDLAVVAKWVKK